jgi:hypothetical protein
MVSKVSWLRQRLETWRDTGTMELFEPTAVCLEKKENYFKKIGIASVYNTQVTDGVFLMARN